MAFWEEVETSYDVERGPLRNPGHGNDPSSSSTESPTGHDRDEGLIETVMPLPASSAKLGQDTLEQELAGQNRSRTDGVGSAEEDLTEVRLPAILNSHRSDLDTPQHDATTLSGQQEKTDAPKASASALSSLNEVYVVGHLIFFAILGTLSRLGVEAINTYPDAPVMSPVLWANAGGSLIFGFLVEDRRLFREEWGMHLDGWSFKPLNDDNLGDGNNPNVAANHLKVKRTIPLYIGLSTGFCGSFTSFSTFMKDAFLALGGQLGSQTRAEASSPRHRGYDFEAVTGVLIVQVACSLAALKFGAHLGLATQQYVPTLPFRLVRKILDPTFGALGVGCWLGALFLAIWPPKEEWRAQALFSLVVAPVGCLFRFYASKHLNRRVPSFPLGTFLSNATGTTVLGICFLIQRSGHRSVLSCQVLDGVMDGFCGCATTVSTWVGELATLRLRHAYIYGIASVAAGLAVLVVVIGSLLWSSGFTAPSCNV